MAGLDRRKLRSVAARGVAMIRIGKANDWLNPPSASEVQLAGSKSYYLSTMGGPVADL